MSDTPDFSSFNWSNSQQGAQSDPADPSTFSQTYNSPQQAQRGNGYGSQHDSPSHGTGNGTATTTSAAAPRDGTDYSTFTFGQPASSQDASQQSGYYNINGGVDPSQTSYQPSDAGAAYTPIDPALTAPPPRQGAGASFSEDPSTEQQGSNAAYLSRHIPPANFNPGRRYSTPALSSTTAPYNVPRRANMFPPSQFPQRPTETLSTTSSSTFAQPPPRSPAFSSSTRSYPQGFNAMDRRMSMPANSLWQLTQSAPQTQLPAVPPHTEPRLRQHSMVDWRLSSQAAPARSSHSNPLLADLDASQGMLSLRGAQWAAHEQSSSQSLEFNSELDERRAGYDPNLVSGTTLGYDTGRRASVDSNATQPGAAVGEGMKKHVCYVCQKKFTRPSSLQTHLYSHTGEKRTSSLHSRLISAFKCEHEGCGRSFSVVSNLRRHKKIHLNSNGK
jgi:hypothetical protein